MSITYNTHYLYVYYVCMLCKCNNYNSSYTINQNYIHTVEQTFEITKEAFHNKHYHVCPRGVAKCEMAGELYITVNFKNAGKFVPKKISLYTVHYSCYLANGVH